ncbi:MAG: hypothetical protein J7619_11260 [Dyadobacter sp.]|nr:hypothetical protein [Dyadobacter sp.]MBO9613268.1 hypothetical protein [Dyadobacter sp.]
MEEREDGGKEETCEIRLRQPTYTAPEGNLFVENNARPNIAKWREGEPS